MVLKRIQVCILVAVAVTGCCPLAAQHIGLTYTTELQTDFRQGTNWVNLLRTDFSQSIGGCFNIEFASISTARTRGERLANDWQTFSNIEEENIPVALAVLGMDVRVGKSFFFFGIRNLNEDYFISPCTSLFTNSSCGIFPTLSANYPIANYPVASIGADYKFDSGNWALETSLYNGTGYRKFTGKENVFRICPQTDGILSVTTINYQNNDNGYYGGIALHYGMSLGDEAGNEKQVLEAEKKKMNVVLWGYIEQNIFRGMHALLQYSVNPTGKNGCRNYAGVGLIFHYKQTVGGFFVDYADFTHKREWACELTYKIPCYKNGYIQPALHLIKNNQEKAVIALLRFGYEL